MEGELGARLEDAVSCSATFTRFIYDLEASVAASTNKSMLSFPETQRALMSNTYLRPAVPAAVPAADLAVGGGGGRVSPLVWISLPLAVGATALIVWVIMREKIRKNKLQI